MATKQFNPSNMPTISRRAADRYRSLPVISQGHTDNLVIDTPRKRVWVSRVEQDKSNKPLVSIETFRPGAISQAFRGKGPGSEWTVTATS